MDGQQQLPTVSVLLERMHNIRSRVSNLIDDVNAIREGDMPTKACDSVNAPNRPSGLVGISNVMTDTQELLGVLERLVTPLAGHTTKSL